MIDLLIQPLTPYITALPFVHKYGGLVRPVSTRMENQNGNITTHTFPIGHNVSHKDCWENDRYLDLVPDERYASIVYFEDRNGVSFTRPTLSKHRRFYEITAGVNLICWLNLPKLGIANTEMSSYFMVEMVEAINRKFKNLDNPIPIPRLEFEFDRQEPITSNPFAAYTYDNYQHLLIYPFNWFSLRININALVHPSCFDIEYGDAYDCIDTQNNGQTGQPCQEVELTISSYSGMLEAFLTPLVEDVDYSWYLGDEQIGTGKTTDIQIDGVYTCIARWGNCEKSETITI